MNRAGRYAVALKYAGRPVLTKSRKPTMPDASAAFLTALYGVGEEDGLEWAAIYDLEGGGTLMEKALVLCVFSKGVKLAA